MSGMHTPGTAPALAPLIVVSGPSGVGKTTVVERLLALANLPIRRAITATTREPRMGEVNARDYHFWTGERFLRERDAGNLLEWAQVFGRDYYGTPRSEVEPFRERGTGVILVIDVQGAGRIRELGLEHLSVFIAPPGFEELESRLRGRGDLTEDRLRQRLGEARTELARADEFQKQIVNRELSEAVLELEHMIRNRFTLAGGQTCSTS